MLIHLHLSLGIFGWPSRAMRPTEFLITPHVTYKPPPEMTLQGFGLAGTSPC